MALEKFTSKLDDLWISERFIGCILEIYNNTSAENDDDLRTAVVNTIVKHLKQLLSKKAFLALIGEGGDFVVDVMRVLAEKCQDDGLQCG